MVRFFHRRNQSLQRSSSQGARIGRLRRPRWRARRLLDLSRKLWQAPLKRLPDRVRKTIHSVNGRGTGTRRWIAASMRGPPRLLPLWALVAFDNPRHQLLGRDLFEVFLSVLREMAVSRRIGTLTLLCRPIKTQPPIQFFFDH